MTVLYHYTCDHARERIGVTGELLTAEELTGGRYVPWQGCVVWLTDLATPLREPLGLTNVLTTCDRTEYRYRVTDDTGAMPYVRFARRLTASMRAELEQAPGAMPKHWWVAPGPVPVELAEL